MFLLYDYTLSHHCIKQYLCSCCWTKLCHFNELYNCNICAVGLYSATSLHCTTVIYLLWTIICPFIAKYSHNIFSAGLYSATWLHRTTVMYMLLDYSLPLNCIVQQSHNICFWTMPCLLDYTLPAGLYSAASRHSTTVIYLLLYYSLQLHWIIQPWYICWWTIFYYLIEVYNCDISPSGLYSAY